MLNLYVELSVLRSLAGARLRREEGAAVIEYGVVVAVIALGFVAVGVALVDGIGDWFTELAANAASTLD